MYDKKPQKAAKGRKKPQKAAKLTTLAPLDTPA